MSLRYVSLSIGNQSLARISKFEAQTKDVLGNLNERYNVQSDMVEERRVKALERAKAKYEAEYKRAVAKLEADANNKIVALNSEIQAKTITLQKEINA